jgi:uncharacterized protein (TIGR02117 family)
VWIVGHELHTGIVVARADVRATDWPEQEDFHGSTYLEVGWGDRDFYRTPTPGIALALKASFFSRGSVLHVVGFDAPVDEFFPAADIVEIVVSRPGFDELCRFIHDSYARSERGDPIRLGPGAYPRSLFYLARGRYHVFDNCNNWAARAIRSTGCPISAASAITPGSVIDQARAFGRVLRLGPSGSR